MVEIPIRENGEVRWVEIDPQLLKNVLRTKSKSSPTQFIEWWNLYDKKTTKKESSVYFKKHITDDLFKKIMEHTKEYIKSNDKVYRLKIFSEDSSCCKAKLNKYK